MKVVQELLGRASLTMTMRYAHSVKYDAVALLDVGSEGGQLGGSAGNLN